jgi:hypothetical protein
LNADVDHGCTIAGALVNFQPSLTINLVDYCMYYPAILISEGTHSHIVFPDLPGCELYVSVNENHLKVAQEVLTRRLLQSLQDGGAPPPPSTKVHASKGESALIVPVAEDVARALLDRWQWA